MFNIGTQHRIRNRKPDSPLFWVILIALIIALWAVSGFDNRYLGLGIAGLIITAAFS